MNKKFSVLFFFCFLLVISFVFAVVQHVEVSADPLFVEQGDSTVITVYVYTLDEYETKHPVSGEIVELRIIDENQNQGIPLDDSKLTNSQGKAFWTLDTSASLAFGSLWHTGDYTAEIITGSGYTGTGFFNVFVLDEPDIIDYCRDLIVTGLKKFCEIIFGTKETQIIQK